MSRFHAACHLPVVAALVLAGCQTNATPAAGPPPDAAAPRRVIASLLAQQAAAWNRGDLAGYLAGYWKSDSLVFIDGQGPTYGWQQNRAVYQRVYPSPAAMGKLTFRDLRITLLAPTAAQVVGRWRLDHAPQGDEHGHFLLVLRQLNGQWAIVADHSSSSR